MAVLSIKDVKYQYVSKYHTVEALKGINYEFEENKIYALIGKSGSGKTTLLSLMAGLDLPSQGEIMFDGKKTSEMDRDKYRRDDAVVIYQTFNLLPLLTVIENVMYPLQLRGMKKEDAKVLAAKSIERVGLNPATYANRLPAMLSGGERQRVAIARALATEAKLVLADEPTGNLDEANTENIMGILTNLAHETGCCVIVVTHDNKIAKQADVTVQIRDGLLYEVE